MGAKTRLARTLALSAVLGAGLSYAVPFLFDRNPSLALAASVEWLCENEGSLWLCECLDEDGEHVSGEAEEELEDEDWD